MNSLETTSIHHLPDEILVQIFSNLSPKDLAAIAPVCELWNRIAGGELSCYKNEKILLNYHLFQDMVVLIQPSEENIALMNIVREKILSKEIFSEEFFLDHVFFQPMSVANSPSVTTNPIKILIPCFKKFRSIVKGVQNFMVKDKESEIDIKSEGTLEQDFYKKLMNAMVQITRSDKSNLLVLQYPLERDSKYKEFARNTLSNRLFNVVHTPCENMNFRIARGLVNGHLRTLILSRSVSKNPEALKQLKAHVREHPMLNTVKLSEVSIVEENDPNHSSIAPISEVLIGMKNLKNILINEFQMTDYDANDLAELIKFKETLERCEIVGEGSLTNEGIGCIFVALRDREFETNFNFKLAFHSEDLIREGLTALQSLDRPNLKITLEKIDSEPQVLE